MNAKKEFIKKVAKYSVLCAYIEIYNYNTENDQEDTWEIMNKYSLKKGYTAEEYKEFLNSLDVEYNDRDGFPLLNGHIWLTDGSWFERYESDGWEGWIRKEYPQIPEFLQ